MTIPLVLNLQAKGQNSAYRPTRFFYILCVGYSQIFNLIKSEQPWNITKFQNQLRK